ncbi:MAG: hypothetical protein KF802_08765 [Bdellovibrionaceae bacterium]|nr:hypothetical protein [Pseudobdellovibrionaceae bacterium]MBX3034140.1 hypothetical protein [Pseudobdellovibrionaceae bacterium]
MTIEYVLLLFVVFCIGLKSFMSAPKDAFLNSGPKLGARIEKQLVTGRDFSLNHSVKWSSDQR